jgi:hypothetical protein
MNYNYYGVDLWENDVIVHDEFDSDQLDEDESYSWASGITDPQDSNAANWRGWRSNANEQPKNNFQKSLSKMNLTETPDTATNRVMRLVDLCARFIASNMPFELVETFSQPVPEDLQLKITFASFPDNPEDIRLYSCLANGNSDDFARGDQLYNCKNVRNLLQIGGFLHFFDQDSKISTLIVVKGFHLSAEVVPLCNTNSNKTQVFNVAVVCDRKKITSCHCSCSKAGSWCSHIVAVCLSRIHEVSRLRICPQMPHKALYNCLLRSKAPKCRTKSTGIRVLIEVETRSVAKVCPVSHQRTASAGLCLVVQGNPRCFREN